jgi:hypothetical protein
MEAGLIGFVTAQGRFPGNLGASRTGARAPVGRARMTSAIASSSRCRSVGLPPRIISTMPRSRAVTSCSDGWRSRLVRSAVRGLPSGFRQVNEIEPGTKGNSGNISQVWRSAAACARVTLSSCQKGIRTSARSARSPVPIITSRPASRPTIIAGRCLGFLS